MPFPGFGPHDDLDIHAKLGQETDEPLLRVAAKLSAQKRGKIVTCEFPLEGQSMPAPRMWHYRCLDEASKEDLNP